MKVMICLLINMVESIFILPYFIEKKFFFKKGEPLTLLTVQGGGGVGCTNECNSNLATVLVK